MELYYKDHFLIAVENVIKYEFPEIKNLKIIRGIGDNFTITFYEGKYTKKQVEDKLKEYKNYKP